MSRAGEITEKLKEYLPIVEMANLRSEETGLNVGVYISTKEGSHGARIKVYPLNKFGVTSLAYHLTIEADPRIVVEPKKDKWLSAKDLRQVKYWIWKNRVELLKLWNMNTATIPYKQITDTIYGLEKV